MKDHLAQLFTRDVNLVLLGAVLGLFLTFTYDRLKDWTQRRDDRRSTLGMLRREVKANLAALASSEEILRNDVVAQKERKQIVVPLFPLTDAAWGLATAGRALSEREYLRLAVLGDAYALTRCFNHQVFAREDYRLNNEAMDNFNTRMTILDNLLLEDAKRLRERLTESVAALEKELT